jgi:predicted O-methyltransferase YrrM
MTSVEASKTFEDKSVDFVFIDAGHTYEEVVEDIKSWLPKVKKGGFIGGHDYYRDPPGKEQEGVHNAVHEFFTHEEIESNEDCWIYPVK